MNNKLYINNKHKEIVENREYKYIGSYKKSEITIDGKNKKYNAYFIRVKCPYCGNEYDVRLDHFKRGDNCTKCCNKYENSFAYHVQQELCESLNEYWDWEKNTVNPYLINKKNKIKIWLKCTEIDYHGSYEKSSWNFYKGERCPYCNHKRNYIIHPKDSFAQWCIDNIDKDFLEKYWSDKNVVNPFDIAPQSMKKVWIKCQNKDYHGDYQTTCCNFTRGGTRCPYCVNHNGKVHPKDSFGVLYPQYVKYWSKRNKLSPYEVAPKSGKKYYFYCEDCKKEFETVLSAITNGDRSMKCRNCNSSKGEQRIKEWFTEYNIKFIPQKEFDGLVGLGNGNLSYDFYLPEHNLLIEYQGEQHYHFIKGLHITQKEFEKQQEHDRRKREYAIDNNIDLLEIWYWDYDNINEILQKRLIN